MFKNNFWDEYLLRSFDTAVTSWPTDQDALGWIPGSAVRFYTSGKLMPVCRIWVFMSFNMLWPIPVLLCLWRRPLNSADLTPGRGASILSVKLYILNRNLHSRESTCKFLSTEEIKRKN